MSTRRGPKVEPHENPRVENPQMFQIEKDYFLIHNNDNPVKIDELPEEIPVSEVPIEELNETIEPEMKAEMEEEGSKEIAEWVDKEIQKNLERLKTEPIVKKKREVKDLNQSELRNYHRTGIIPE